MTACVKKPLYIGGLKIEKDPRKISREELVCALRDQANAILERLEDINAMDAVSDIETLCRNIQGRP